MVTLYDTIRLDTTLSSGLPVAQYSVAFDDHNYGHEPALSIERSITGRVVVHRITSSGSPITYDVHSYTVIATKDEYDTLSGLLGKNVYFMPNRRDEDDPDNWRKVMVLSTLKAKLVDPMMNYVYVTIELMESRGNTADT